MKGIGKPKTVTLKRLLPATVNLNQKRIKIDATGSTGESKLVTPELIGILQTKLITAIQKDNRFILDTAHPETLLTFKITNYYVEYRDLPVPNSKTNQQCRVWTGKIEASYQAIEMNPPTHAPLDSENLKYAITADPPAGASILPFFGSRQGSCGTHAKGSANEARDELIDAIVAQMAMRAAPTEESVTVPLPGGKLEPLSAMAMSQRWGTLLEEAEKMDKLPKPEDDAYRLYLIALANEALAYEKARDTAELEKNRRSDMTSDKAKQSMEQEEKNFTQAEAYLDQATKSYKDAIQMKSGEKEFREPDARMEKAVRLYATIARHKQEYQDAVLQKGSRNKVAQSNPAPTNPGPAASAAGTRSAKTAPPPAQPQAGAVASPFTQVIGMCGDQITGIGQLIKDHPDDLHFQKSLSLNEDLQIRKECGKEAAGIEDAIKAQLTGKKKLP